MKFALKCAGNNNGDQLFDRIGSASHLRLHIFIAPGLHFIYLAATSVLHFRVALNKQILLGSSDQFRT